MREFIDGVPRPVRGCPKSQWIGWYSRRSGRDRRPVGKLGDARFNIGRYYPIGEVVVTNTVSTNAGINYLDVALP